MKRDITNKLQKWKESPTRKPLIIRGARQVGKTYSVLDFGKSYKGKVHHINFEKDFNWKKVFEKDLNAPRILSELEILLNTTIHAGDDLLFFDEIQYCPNAIMSLRYFYEQLPKIHVAAAGSLLEFALTKISFPVGRVQFLDIHPMRFSEFLTATGKDKLAEIINAKPVKLSRIIHETILENLFTYFFVGGMPEAVKYFRDFGKLSGVFDIHADLIDTYIQDFSKYSPATNRDCLTMVFQSVGKSVGHQIKYAHLASGFSNPTIKGAFMALKMARLINSVKASSPSGLPLEANANERKFKTIFLDVGLMAHLNGLSSQYVEIKEKIDSVFNGALAEQFVGQEFLASGQKGLYYWARESKSSTAEVDYLLVRVAEIFPVEVKNSSSGRLKSLHLLLKEYPNCKKAFVLSHAEYGKLESQKLEFVPIYYASQLAMERNIDI
jgi:predicted AAA+ superfamily ATPase